MHTYVVAGTRPWNRWVFDETIRRFPGKWHYVMAPSELDADWLEELAPRYVFFLHWSSRIPREVFKRHECVVFHMTNLPFGRGGSPLQNLILRGHKETVMTAIRVVDELDAGPVYLKAPLALDGTAQEILVRATRLSARMILQMTEAEIVPSPQDGDIVIFSRREPRESRLPEGLSLEGLYNFIRMLDAETYPRAFVDFGGVRFEFSHANLYDDRVVANVTATVARGSSS